VTHCKKNKILSFKLASREATYIPNGAGILCFSKGQKILEYITLPPLTLNFFFFLPGYIVFMIIFALCFTIGKVKGGRHSQNVRLGLGITTSF
jgi:hypothetical protein